MKPTAQPAGGTVTATSPPPDRYGVRYWDRSKHDHVIETCWDVEAIRRRLADIQQHTDASAYLVRQTGSGVWRSVTPAVAS